jgi:hypothetical protein
MQCRPNLRGRVGTAGRHREQARRGRDHRRRDRDQRAPDGYTLLRATSGEISIIPAISAKQLRYDSQKDLIPIALVSKTPFVWVVNVKSGITSLPDLVARAKAKPGELAYSSAGNGGAALLLNIALAYVVPLLIGLVVAVTPIFHRSWQFEGERRTRARLAFLSNVGLIGGMLALLAASL